VGLREGENVGNQKVALEIIEDFLAQKRIALVGLSRQPKDFSVMLFEELCRRGYDVVPVNPGAAEKLWGGPALPVCRTSSLRSTGCG
jgi:predicted CoA-binding protein